MIAADAAAKIAEGDAIIEAKEAAVKVAAEVAAANKASKDAEEAAIKASKDAEEAASKAAEDAADKAAVVAATKAKEGAANATSAAASVREAALGADADEVAEDAEGEGDQLMDDLCPETAGALYPRMEKNSVLVWEFFDKLNVACTDLKGASEGNFEEFEKFRCFANIESTMAWVFKDEWNGPNGA